MNLNCPSVNHRPIHGIVLLGGGILLRRLCLWAKSINMDIKVVTAPRHAAEIIGNQTMTDFLEDRNVSYLVTSEISTPNVAEFIGDTRSYFCLSLGAAWIFRNTLIESLFHNRLFNLHSSRLPQDRGGGGFSWQILMGNRFGACTLHQVDAGVDTGGIASQHEFIFPPECRRPIDCEEYYTEQAFGLISKFVLQYKSCGLAGVSLDPIGQPECLSTYWPRLNTLANGWIDWSMEPTEIERFICAFDEPYAGAQTYLSNNRKVHLKKVCLTYQDGNFHRYQSGLVYRTTPQWICVALRGATLIVQEVYNEDATSILEDVRVGDRFQTPTSVLDASKWRPIYNANGLKDDQ